MSKYSFARSEDAASVTNPLVPSDPSSVVKMTESEELQYLSLQ
ncbi:MAG: hypothetical protein ACRCUT_04575 [Spirochaetota bacterium]